MFLTHLESRHRQVFLVIGGGKVTFKLESAARQFGGLAGKVHDPRGLGF